MTASPKHARVHTELRNAILSGHLPPGTRLPSEAAMTRQYGVSRITITRAMHDLHAAGLIDRRVGAGSFVAARGRSAGRSFGLLIPNLGDTDIFEPICRAMMASPLARDHALLWGSAPGTTTAASDAAWTMCRQYLDRGVDGVFFAPLEGVPAADALNARIVETLDRTSIPVVLLDRAIAREPDPGRHDLVGIDNRQAAHLMTRHLLALGAQRVAFVARQDAASTVDGREAGYRDAVRLAATPHEPLVYRLATITDATLHAVISAPDRPDAMLCANDRTAGEVMQVLARRGLHVPRDVRLVGIDDAGYAALLPVPLTTFRQPVDAIGDTALAVMLDRVARPGRPPRDTLLHGELVVRESCGANVQGPANV